MPCPRIRGLEILRSFQSGKKYRFGPRWPRRFTPERSIKIATTESELRAENGDLIVHTLGSDGNLQDFHPNRVLGETPLRQFLVPTEEGRVQATSLAFDPTTDEWLQCLRRRRPPTPRVGFLGQPGHELELDVRRVPTTPASIKTTTSRPTVTIPPPRNTASVARLAHGPGEAHVEWRNEFSSMGTRPDPKPDPKKNSSTPAVFATRDGPS